MDLEKAKNNIINRVDKVIYFNDNVEVKHGDSIINERGDIYIINFSGENPVMEYFDDDGKIRHYGTLEEYGINRYAKVDRPIEEIDQIVLDIINGKRKIQDFEIGSKEPLEESNQLVHLKSSDSLVQLKNQMEIQQNHVKAIHLRLAGMLEQKRQELVAVVDGFREKLTKIFKVLYTIELYLGVNEEVVQLTEGAKALVDTPICLRQQILYMDEEIGIYENGGIGFQDIPKFDEWITNHFKEILQEEKGVIVFRVRRNAKDYGSSFENELNRMYDKKTYFLIRNGDNLYRIFADIIVHPRLFPLKNELAEIFQKIEKDPFKESRQKEADNLIMQYQRTALVLQGILDRTDIFSPVPEGINIFNPDTYENFIKLIYDEENLLPSGRKSFNEWQKEINAQIERGSRILYHFDWRELGGNDNSDRFFIWRRYYPTIPRKDQIFTVEDIVKEKPYNRNERTVIKVLFMEQGHYYHEPKKRVALRLHFDDWFILNYDKISLDDIEFYINSRVDRPNYLVMLPVLIQAKQLRLAEIEWEKEFVKMTIGELQKEGCSVDEKDVWSAIDWWKNKVIWKRPITKDDAKALRMIKSKLKNN